MVTRSTDITSVLVVDDEDVLLDMISAILSDEGFHVLTATNGQEALQLLKKEDTLPQVILCDVMMPRMGGVELVATIRADDRLSRLPVVLMSAAGKPRTATKADFFISKPFDLDFLVTVIDRYLTERAR